MSNKEPGYVYILTNPSFRAGRLINQLEYAGIVGAAHGSKPREVLIMDEKSLEDLLAQWKE